MPHVPASPESRPSSPRPFDFADLGKPTAVKAAPPAPPVAQAQAPVVPAAAASGDLDELSADDILESDDIETFEVAAAGFKSFDAPPSDPSGFEIAEIDTFEEIEVEGLAARTTEPPPAPAPVAVISHAPMAMTGEAAQYVAPVAVEAPKVEAPKVEAVEAAPASIKVDYTAPSPSTLIGMPSVIPAAAIPPAPTTSPIALESIIVDDAFPEKTLELRSNDVSKVAAAAAALDASEPQQTEVLKRSDMPAALNTQTLRGGMQAVPTPAPAAVHTPSTAFAVQQARTAPGWQNGQPHAQRPGSIAPVALDVASLPRPTMPSIAGHAPVAAVHAAHAARPVKKGMSGLAIGGIVFAAVAFVGLVGVGGFAASRALSDKAEPVASSTTTTTTATTTAAPSGEGAAASAAATTAPAEPATAAAAAAVDPASPATLDVSALPSAPVPGAAPRGFTGSGSFTPPSTPTPSPTTATVAAAPVAQAAPAPRGNGGSPLAAPGQGSTSSGIKTTALPAPGTAPVSPVTAGSTPLPPPSPPVAAAPAPAAAQSSTGIVRVDPNLRAVVVDGSYRRATDGVLTVSCGSHRIKAGMKEQQTVNVPCGGSVSL